MTAKSDSKPYGVIYCIPHIDTDRVYIGQTVGSILQRWSAHKATSYCVVLHRAIKKYGAGAFSIEQIDRADSKDELDSLEAFYISAFGSTSRSNGFNLRGGGSFGKHSAESKARMSVAVRKAYENPEFKAKLIAAKTGVKHTPERIAKVALANTGKRHTDESKKKMAAASSGRWADPAQRASLVALQNAGRDTDQFREKASANTKRQWAENTESMLANIDRARELGADARAATWADPEKRAARLAKMSIASSGKVTSQETKEKLSAALKGRPKPVRSKEHSAKIAEAVKRHYAAKKAAQI